MIRVKICGLTRSVDVATAIEAGADALGMVFAPSPRQVSVAKAKKIMQLAPPQILRVGVFVDQDPKWIMQVMHEVGLDRVQFHGHESQKIMRAFTRFRVIRALRPTLESAIPKKDPAPAAGALLVDAYVPGKAGGTGKKANWKYAKALKRFGKPVILSGGLNTQNITEAIQKVRPDMVDVSSGVELQPGIKSTAKIKRFIQLVRKG
jgi:phosphoribosylanthranilate isomerase